MLIKAGCHTGTYLPHRRAVNRASWRVFKPIVAVKARKIVEKRRREGENDCIEQDVVDVVSNGWMDDGPSHLL